MARNNSLINKYLLLYNGIQSIGWYYVVFLMIWRYISQGGSESLLTTYDRFGTIVCSLQIFAFLEIINVLLGLVRSSLMPTIAQVFGRNHVLLFALAYVPQVQSHWGVSLMFLIWGLSELIRYPFYIFGNNSPKFLIWLRYNAFIILYPIGFAAENILWYQMLPYFLEYRIHFIDMPNSLNFSFNYYYFALFWIATTLLFFPQQYLYMFKLRAKKMN